MKQNLFYLLALLNFLALDLYSQNRCGFQDITVQQRDQLISQYTDPNPPQVAASSTSPWKMSVLFYELRNTDGSLTAPAQTQFSTVKLINGLNTTFNGLFEFVECGYTVIENDDWAVLDQPGDEEGLMNYINGLNNPDANSSIRVVLLTCGVYSPTGVSGYSSLRLFSGASTTVFLGINEPKLFAHEMGHYFGLLHTFNPLTPQYVNPSVEINGEIFTCLQLGDGMCDTAADPGDPGCDKDVCPSICIINDPLGVPYDPDETLLMGYHPYDCQNRFSAEQRQFMRSMYLTNTQYSPLRTISPNCLTVKNGYIEHYCGWDIGGGISGTISPLVGLEVSVFDANINCNLTPNLTDNQGKYLITPCSALDFLPRRFVLPNKNHTTSSNDIDANDANMILSHISGENPFLNSMQMIAADLNYSGTISVQDVRLARWLSFGFISNSDLIVGPWRYIPNFLFTSTSFNSQFNDLNPFDAIFNDPITGVDRSYFNPSFTLPNSLTWMDHLNMFTNSVFAANENAWSFKAIRSGDVDCTFDANRDTEGNIVTPISVSPYFDFYGPEIDINTGDELLVSIWANSEQIVSSWQTLLHLPQSNIFELVSLGSGNVPYFDNPDKYLIDANANFDQNMTQISAMGLTGGGAPYNIENKILMKFKVKLLGDYSYFRDFITSDFGNAIETKMYNQYYELIRDSIVLSVHVEKLKGDEVHISKRRNSVLVENVKFYNEGENLQLDIISNAKEKVDCRLINASGQLCFASEMNLLEGDNNNFFNLYKPLPSGLYFFLVQSTVGTQTFKIFIK